MVGREDFKKKAKEMAEKARAKAQAEKGTKGKPAEPSEAERTAGRPSGTTEELKRQHGEGPSEE